MAEEYAQQITHQAVARACVALDVKTSYSSVIEALSDITGKYIQNLTENAKEFAETSGRNTIGIQDILASLEQTRPKLTNWKELRDFSFQDVKNPNVASDTKWSQPFLNSVPNFPIKARKPDKEFNYKDVNKDQPKDLPDHFPQYPPLHTYKRTDGNSKKRERVESENKQRLLSSRRCIQKSLAKIEDAVEKANSLDSTQISRVFSKESTIANISPALDQDDIVINKSINLNHIPAEKLESLSKEHKMLLGISHDSL